MRPAFRSIVPVALSALALAAVLAAPPRAALAKDSIYDVIVTPDYLEVAGGTHVKFQAALLRKGEKKFLRQDWQWRCEAGHFSDGGETAFAQNTWIAPMRPGTYTIRVTQNRARDQEVWGTATVIVVPPAPRPVPIVCRHAVRLNATDLTLQPGATFRFSTTTCGCHSAGSLVWRTAGGTIEDGLFVAGPRVGNYVVEVLNPALKATAVCTVRIVAPPARAVRVALNPPRTECLPGGVIEFDPRAYDAEGREIAGATLGWDWSCEGGGVIDVDGVLRAPGGQGRYVVRAREQGSGLVAQAEVVVRPGCRQIAIQAPSLECAPGERLQLLARGFDAEGRGITGCDFEWRLASWPIGQDPRAVAQNAPPPVGGARIAPDGLFFADGPGGQYTVVCRERWTNVESSVVVTVRSQAVRILNLSPRVVILKPGMRQRFTFQGYDAQNRAVEAAGIQLSAEAGQIGPDGWFTAPFEAGRHVKVKAVDPRSGASDWADVYVSW